MEQELGGVMPLVPLQTFPWWLDVTGDAQTHKATLKSPRIQSAETYIHTYIETESVTLGSETESDYQLEQKQAKYFLPGKLILQPNIGIFPPVFWHPGCELVRTVHQ